MMEDFVGMFVGNFERSYRAVETAVKSSMQRVASTQALPFMKRKRRVQHRGAVRSCADAVRGCAGVLQRSRDSRIFLTAEWTPIVRSGRTARQMGERNLGRISWTRMTTRPAWRPDVHS